MKKLCATFACLSIVLLCTAQTQKLGTVDWPVYRGDSKANQYAALAQINATNVHKLRRAWEYHTSDNPEGPMYANPIVVDGVMYISTTTLKAVALDAATGARKWSFDPVALHDGAPFSSTRQPLMVKFRNIRIRPI